MEKIENICKLIEIAKVGTPVRVQVDCERHPQKPYITSLTYKEVDGVEGFEVEGSFFPEDSMYDTIEDHIIYEHGDCCLIEIYPVNSSSVDRTIKTLVQEAKLIGISKEDLLEKVKSKYE